MSHCSTFTKNKFFPKKCVIFGIEGFIGSYLFRRWKDFFPDTIGFGRRSGEIFSLEDLKITDLKTDAKYAIIAAGITNIAKCEKDPQRSYEVNVAGTLKLVEYLVSKDIIPIVFSSDYVFDGEMGRYTEGAKTNPINVYGKQKAELEKEINLRFADKCIILRLSKVYGQEEDRKTIFREMIDLLENKKTVAAAIDQIFCPIHIRDIFHTICYLQNHPLRGLFNVCGPHAWSRYDLACVVAKKFGFKENSIRKTYLKDLGENFKRPTNTSMVSNRLNFKEFSSVEKNLENIMSEYARKKSME